MAEGPLQVELVAADRTVWSGQATMVIARTVEGDVGVLKDHAPLLSLLADAVVEIETGDETIVAAVDGGFISVAHNRVSILSEQALLADEIDVKAVESRAGGSALLRGRRRRGPGPPGRGAAPRRREGLLGNAAWTRLRAVGRPIGWPDRTEGTRDAVVAVAGGHRRHPAAARRHLRRRARRTPAAAGPQRRLRAQPPGRPRWVLGFGRYSGETLEWFRIFSLSARPKASWQRDELTYDGRREPLSAEQMSLYPDHLVIQCQTARGVVELAMSAGLAHRLPVVARGAAARDRLEPRLKSR